MEALGQSEEHSSTAGIPPAYSVASARTAVPWDVGN
jgi:hypothetical protein